MESEINKKYVISIVFLVLFYFVFSILITWIPFANIILEGQVEWDSNLTAIKITNYIFGNGNNLRYLWSSNPIYNPINLWELNLNEFILKSISSILTITIMISPLWHFVPQRKYRTAIALIFLIIENIIILTWIFYIYVAVLNENSVLVERYISSSENLFYTAHFTNAIIIMLIITGLMTTDILFNNRFIVEEIRDKTNLKYDNIIDNSLKFEDSQYENIRVEINQAYRNYMFPSMYILIRKLLENLIYDCLRNFYQEADIDKYYNKHRRKHHNLSTLIANFKSMMKDPYFLRKADQIEDKLIIVLESFRERGNKNAHSLFNLRHQSFMEDKRELLNILLKNMKSLEKRLHN